MFHIILLSFDYTIYLLFLLSYHLMHKLNYFIILQNL